MNHTISIVVPSFNGGALLKRCLEGLRGWEVVVGVVDSGSKDNSVSIARQFNVEVLGIEAASFNHGVTRELARKHWDRDIVVFLTQDVEIQNFEAISFLIRPILSGEAEVAYGRQLPRDGAGFFERFPREYNCPAESQVRTLKDVDRFGAFTFFCSDSFAAYSQKALNDVGGFESTLTHEDYFTVAKILKSGGRIAYVAEAEVIHSHDYSLWQEFQRYFDAGYVRAVNPWVTQLVGHAENHGKKFFRELIRRLMKEAPYLIPYACLQSIVKWAGYRMGYLCFRAPTWVKKLLSGQAYYFDSKYYISGKN